MLPHEKISGALKGATEAGRVGLVPFITAGYPKKDEFIPTLREICKDGDVVEVGVPFSDPMADGVTIQRSSHSAIEQGVTLHWIIDELKNSVGMNLQKLLQRRLKLGASWS